MKFSKEQWIGILLIIAALLIWMPFSIPFINQNAIGALIVVAIGVYKLIFS